MVLGRQAQQWEPTHPAVSSPLGSCLLPGPEAFCFHLSAEQDLNPAQILASPVATDLDNFSNLQELFCSQRSWVKFLDSLSHPDPCVSPYSSRYPPAAVSAP